MQAASSWAPKVARKCESKHWYICGADGRAAGGRAVYGHMITKFSRMGRFTYHGAPQARFARQSSAIILPYTNQSKMKIEPQHYQTTVSIYFSFFISGSFFTILCFDRGYLMMNTNQRTIKS